jgi:hypothetical protein
MGAAGADASKIWQETGWDLGTDGHWRYEISDHNAHMIAPVKAGDGDCGRCSLLILVLPPTSARRAKSARHRGVENFCAVAAGRRTIRNEQG